MLVKMTIRTMVKLFGACLIALGLLMPLVAVANVGTPTSVFVDRGDKTVATVSKTDGSTILVKFNTQNNQAVEHRLNYWNQEIERKEVPMLKTMASVPVVYLPEKPSYVVTQSYIDADQATASNTLPIILGLLGLLLLVGGTTLVIVGFKVSDETLRRRFPKAYKT